VSQHSLPHPLWDGICEAGAAGREHGEGPEHGGGGEKRSAVTGDVDL